MALVKSYNCLNALNVDAVVLIHCTRTIGRKRITLSNRLAMEMLPRISHCRSPSKIEKSLLEALPQEILIRILCCVDHDDLKQLMLVSKLIRDTTLIAKKSHFTYSTPRAKISGLRSSGSDLEHDCLEAPNAPKQRKKCPRSRISRKKLSDISVALFRSPEGEWLSRDALCVHREGFE
ncbi:hypothetical protein NE237_031800 [Protea cynaroides]|uniref:F-box domain-containing protein n=1 Tax=Protea cynaroides TaxID=273540 RepID=A0A9Q0L1V7_9MAGN|nr:hypothetical protein NE237_031800 [Protea cynaroides]